MLLFVNIMFNKTKRTYSFINVADNNFKNIADVSKNKNEGIPVLNYAYSSRTETSRHSIQWSEEEVVDVACCIVHDVLRWRSSLAARAVSSPNEFIASSLTLLTRANELEVPSHPGPIPNHIGAHGGSARYTHLYTRVSDLYTDVSVCANVCVRACVYAGL